MNRTILIVICDFLLVSLLAFSAVDINKVADQAAPRQVSTTIVMNPTNRAEADQDLTAVMRLALNEERRSRDVLLAELAKSRQTAAQQQGLLNEREQQTQALRQELQVRDQEAQRLTVQQSALQQQFATAQTNLQALNQQLRSAAAEASTTRERLQAVEAEAKRQSDEAAALQRQLALLAQTNQAILNEKQRLASQLQVAEVERRHAAEQAAAAQAQVKLEREEKARLAAQATKLAEGVQTLASKSGELATEIRENRPLAPNTIFNEFLTNRVAAQLTASRPGLFADATRRADTHTVVVGAGTNYYAITHIQDTPLTLGYPATQWETLAGTLRRQGVSLPVESLSFIDPDPRVVYIRLTEAEVRRLGGATYRLSPNPFKFQEAVLVGAREGYYGECRFEIDPSAPDYLLLDKSFVRGLFGKFNPSRGDLVFSRTGELLGIMVNNSYCLMIKEVRPSSTLYFGEDVKAQRTDLLLSRMYSKVASMPLKLQ